MNVTHQYALLGLLLFNVACSNSSDDPSNAGSGGSIGVGGNGGATGINVNGGRGGTDTSSAGNGNVCDKIQLETSSLPPRVVFVQDLSSSMTGQWQPLDDAMVAIAQQYGDRLQLGLIPFSSVYLDNAEEIRSRYEAGGTANDTWFSRFFDANDDDCNISDTSIIAPALGNAEEVVAVYDSVIEARMVGGTPTYTAMTKTREVLVENAPSDGSSAYAILVTDGEPNCSSPTGDGFADVETAIATLADEGVKTYVVGYMYDGAVLDRWAKAGETTSYYNAADTATLNAEISSILTGLIPCEYTLSATVDDVKFVRVTIDGEDRALDNSQNGWNLANDQRTVVLNGEACQDLRSSGNHTINVVVECAEVVIIQ